MKQAILIISIAGLFLAAGCDVCVIDDDDWNCGACWCDDTPPPVPSGVHSVTGDGMVYIYWTPINTWDMEGYDVYRGDSPTGYYEYLGSTRAASYSDYYADNGRTYYYAIASYDDCGNTSELSTDMVYDTPRPDGFSYYLWAAETYTDDGGFDFSEYGVVAWDYPSCDFFFGHDSLGYYLCAANDYTDILDYGPATTLSDVDVAPESGWSTYADVAATAGHAYVIWTADNHFATVLIREISGERLTFDWAYQTAPGNPELKITRSKPPEMAGIETRRGLLVEHRSGEEF